MYATPLSVNQLHLHQQAKTGQSLCSFLKAHLQAGLHVEHGTSQSPPACLFSSHNWIIRYQCASLMPLESRVPDWRRRTEFQMRYFTKGQLSSYACSYPRKNTPLILTPTGF